MQQAINLFDHLEKRESIKVSSQHIALAAIVTVCVVLLVSLVTLYNSSQDAHALQLAQEKDESLQAQLTSLQACNEVNCACKLSSFSCASCNAWASWLLLYSVTRLTSKTTHTVTIAARAIC